MFGRPKVRISARRCFLLSIYCLLYSTLLGIRNNNNIVWRFYTVKKNFSAFPSLAGMSLTKLSLGRNNDVIYKVFPPRESLVSDIPAGDGNIEKLFFTV
jgi:hypothetical protein